MNKTQRVLEHLKTKGSITSWDAIQLYKATRLSAIIFNLRQRGYNIITKEKPFKDINGDTSYYAEYILEE